jgi:formylglycine-generating enzyme required for sulfatase activity
LKLLPKRKQIRNNKKTNMKSLLFKSVLNGVFLLCVATAWGQDKEMLAMFEQSINTHLSDGNCGKAEDAYNSWKAYTGRSDASVERRIAACKSGEITGNGNQAASATKTLQGVKLLYIKGGTFTMGSPDSEPGRWRDEVQHAVTVNGFYLSEKEITNEQFCRFLNATGVSGDGQGNVSGHGVQTLIEEDFSGVKYVNGSWQPATGKANYPVVKVSWYGAKAYCDWAGGRLPAEAEWEYACRAGTTTPFNTGRNLSASQANYNDGINFDMQPTGSYAPNAWGLYDMHGNVSEWCSDWYGPYSNSPQTDPQGPSSGSSRVLRGGSWYNKASDCRVSHRDGDGPGIRRNGSGFRLALSL